MKVPIKPTVPPPLPMDMPMDMSKLVGKGKPPIAAKKPKKVKGY